MHEDDVGTIKTKNGNAVFRLSSRHLNKPYKLTYFIRELHFERQQYVRMGNMQNPAVRAMSLLLYTLFLNPNATQHITYSDTLFSKIHIPWDLHETVRKF